jgi:hypothetical protein
VGATQLQRLQVGKETVKGTAVTTGKILTGILRPDCRHQRIKNSPEHLSDRAYGWL